ncbi:hypothetical protein L2Y96_04185 [Luteibacter aegosomaticola]|uniref:hypothetical protein n=1 Tax=Luteibacter aegosomaticola TaxID=2911538 RepID=UPI001FF73C7E|nr:hypothetical protein [Luteibacter aegosomaticola]UPG90985.1 hypothetical protein L2Y96_04185 [Luteibacter aegosomaticola]
MSFAPIIAFPPATLAPATKAHAWQVLREASRIEPDEAARIAWYRDEPIVALDRHTAETLVTMGRYVEVLAFLRGVRMDLGLEPSHGFGAF